MELDRNMFKNTKRGPKGKALEVSENGITQRFESVKEFATYFDISQPTARRLIQEDNRITEL